jgi:hypothetical protein
VGTSAVALAADSERYLGRQLLVEPEYGHGWNAQIPTSGWYPEVEVPPTFHFVIERFFRFEGSLRGGIGTIHESGHALDGLLLGFSARYTGEHHFAGEGVRCNLTVGTQTRVAENGWLFAVGAPALVGFGVLRDDAA